MSEQQQSAEIDAHAEFCSGTHLPEGSCILDGGVDEPPPYINATCRVGQSEPCGAETTHVIAVTKVADAAWASEGRDGGVVGLCTFHATTPVTQWDSAIRPAGGEGR